MAEVTGRRPALAQERIWSSVCSTAVSEWDCREMSGLSMVYSQPRSPNALVTAVAVENRHHPRTVRSACGKFQRRPNGSWTVLRSMTISPQGVQLNLALGQTFANNQYVSGIETMSKKISGRSRSVPPRAFG